MVEIDLTTLQGWSDLADGIYNITVGATAQGYERIKVSEPVQITKGNPQPVETGYILFSSSESFNLYTYGYVATWDGTLEYSEDGTNWTVWDGTNMIGGSTTLYLRGTSNTYISGAAGTTGRFVIAGTNVSCSGNIENLLDYQTVLNGNHPAMASKCFNYLFRDCQALITTPSHGGITNVSNCYSYMYRDCINITTLPKLYATNIESSCYRYMFSGCSNIKLSTTQDSEYVNEYRIPFIGEGTGGGSAVGNMFMSTGGTYTGDPQINTTYYTSNQLV